MFSDVLNTLLKQKQINTLTLAKQIGVPKSIVYEWKHGIREPSVDSLLRLSVYFGVSLAYLTEREEAADPEESELLLLFRTARTLSPEDHKALLQSFRDNLDRYLNDAPAERDET